MDYKNFAKTLANRLKKCMNNLISQDQSGFLKGRYIGTNIRLIMDVIEYSEMYDIPGAIALIDIEKAFDSVRYDFFVESIEEIQLRRLIFEVD